MKTLLALADERRELNATICEPRAQIASQSDTSIEMSHSSTAVRRRNPFAFHQSALSESGSTRNENGPRYERYK